MCRTMALISRRRDTNLLLIKFRQGIQQMDHFNLSPTRDMRLYAMQHRASRTQSQCWVQAQDRAGIHEVGTAAFRRRHAAFQACHSFEGCHASQPKCSMFHVVVRHHTCRCPYSGPVPRVHRAQCSRMGRWGAKACSSLEGIAITTFPAEERRLASY